MTQEIILIAAMGRQGQIGLNGGLPWGKEFPEDRQRFRDQTKNNLVIMGWKTYQTCSYLAGTHNRIFSIDPFYVPIAQCVAHFKDLYPDRHLFIAGGAKTYQRWLPFITRMDITTLPYEGPADTYMPCLFQGGENTPLSRVDWLQTKIDLCDHKIDQYRNEGRTAPPEVIQEKIQYTIELLGLKREDVYKEK